MKYGLCTDLFYLEIGPTGPVFSDTNKLLEGMELARKTGLKAVEFWDWLEALSAVCSKGWAPWLLVPSQAVAW